MINKHSADLIYIHISYYFYNLDLPLLGLSFGISIYRRDQQKSVFVNFDLPRVAYLTLQISIYPWAKLQPLYDTVSISIYRRAAELLLLVWLANLDLPLNTKSKSENSVSTLAR